MGQAWIAGKPAPLDAAAAEAAKLLAASRLPLIAGLGTDVAGARAAIALARRTGAVIDHMHSDALLRELDVMRSSGTMLTTPGETRVHANLLLLVGSGFEGPAAEMLRGLNGKTGAEMRRVIRLCPGRETTAPGFGKADSIGKEPKDLPALLAMLRARVAGRPVAKGPVSAKALDEIAGVLKAARFGVAVWTAGTLDTLTVGMLCGLVNDLNAMTRFSTLPLAPADNALGVLQACAWMTGLPMRTGFGLGVAEHDPYLFDGDRLIESGETDCVVWISAYSAAAPDWRKAPPMIALTGRDAGFRSPPRVHIEIGRPGVDHPAVEYVAAFGALAAVPAAQPSGAIAAADAIARIAAALPGDGGRPC